MKGSRHTAHHGQIPSFIANDATTLAFVTRIAIRDDRQSRGIWSRYGQAYVPHGVPDFTLSPRYSGVARHAFAELIRFALRMKSRLRRNQEEDELGLPTERRQSKSGTSSHVKLPAGSRSPPQQTRELGSVHHKSDSGRYRFPREKIHESEIRCRKGKNGKFLSSKSNATDMVFAPINLSKIGLPEQRTIERPKQPAKQAEYRLYQDQLNDLDDQGMPFSPVAYTQLNKLSSAPEDHTAIPARRPSRRRTSGDSPLSRWRNDFSTLRKMLCEKLQETLARQQMDRSMVMHNRTLLSKLTESVERRAADRLPQKTSVWSEVAHECKTQQHFKLKGLDHFTLDNRKRTELYDEIQVFVQKLCAEEFIEPLHDETIVSTIEAIRTSLEDRAHLDLSLLVAVISKLDPKTQESRRHLKIISFLCNYLKISLEEVQEWEEKIATLPPSLHAIITA